MLEFGKSLFDRLFLVFLVIDGACGGPQLLADLNLLEVRAETPVLLDVQNLLFNCLWGALTRIEDVVVNGPGKK